MGSSVRSPGEGLRVREEALMVGCRGETCQEIGWERLEMKRTQNNPGLRQLAPGTVSWARRTGRYPMVASEGT